MPEATTSKSPGAAIPSPKTAKKKKRNRRWESLLEAYEAGDFQVVPLTTSDELRTEGYLMDHCLGRYYPTWCKQGFIRAFSIRDLDGRRVATVSLLCDSIEHRWRLEQCKGIGNREVVFEGTAPTDLHFLAEDIVRLYQMAYEKSGTFLALDPTGELK